MTCNKKTIYLCVCLLVVVFAACFVDAAPARSGPRLSPREALRVKEAAQLAKTWGLLYKGKASINAAAKAVMPLLKSRDEAVRVEASYLAGRILWNKGDKKSQEMATKRWQTLSRQSTLNVLKPRLEITEALKLRAAGKHKEAIAKLESLLSNPYPATCTPEAAILLGEFATWEPVKDYKKAAQAASFALSYCAKLLEMKELTPAQLAPFKARATKLKKAIVQRKLADRKKKKTAAKEETKPDAQKAYDAAAKLRVAKKYSPAVRAYMAVAKAHPDTQWAGRSEYDIGLCMRAEKNESGAIRWWKKFIDKMPDGPWRAQAYLQVIDAYMEHTLDVDAALDYATKAAGAIASGLRDTVGAPSWKLAALDLHLRVGLLSYVKGDTRQVAVSLTEAKKSAKAKTFRQASIDGLNRLIASAKKGQPLLPVDVSSKLVAANTKGDKAANCLGMGLVYHIMGRHHQADLYFGQVREKKAVRGTPAQIAFAEYGHGLVQRSLDEPAVAMKAFKDSLRLYSRGTWHDATLYQLATMTTDQAMAAVGQAKQRMEAALAAAANPQPKSAAKPGAKKSAKPKSAKQLESEYAAAQRAFLSARRKAMFYWQAIYKKYPDSQYMEPAMYYAALLDYETAQAKAATGGAGSAKAFESVLVLMTAFVQKYPTSPYAGDLHVKRIDVALEQLFSLSQSVANTREGLAWLTKQGLQIAVKADGTPTEKSLQAAARKAHIKSIVPCPLWAGRASSNPSFLLSAAYNLHLRAGILAYLQENYDQAIKHLQAAGPARPQEGKQANYDLKKIGLFILANSCRRKQVAWYPDALAKVQSKNLQLALKLADTYIHVQRSEKSIDIFERILRSPTQFGGRSADAEGYCYMRLALAYSEKRVHRDRSIVYYKKFYLPKYAKQSWAADAIMCLAVLEYNATQDPKRSIGHYKHILKHYPDHREAERALYFMALDAVTLKDKKLAEASCKEFLQRFPSSGWKDHINKVLTTEIPTLDSTKKGKRS